MVTTCSTKLPPPKRSQKFKSICLSKGCPFMASPALPGDTSSPTSGELPAKHDYLKGVKHLVDTTRDLRLIAPKYIIPASPLPVSDASIPVIDLSGLDEPADQRMEVVQSISLACAHWGCFRIVNHGISASLMEEMLKSVDGFFALPIEEKMKYRSDDVMNPVRYGTSLNSSTPHALHWRDYLRHFGQPIGETMHLWPDKPPNYREVAKEYLEEIWRLALKLAGAISQGLGLRQGYIEESLGQGSQILAANYYPPCPFPTETLGLCAHSDHGGLTILTQNEVDGLQVKHEGAWVPVHHVPHSFIVLLGDYLEILSNGDYQSVEHQALVNAERRRISIGVGHGPPLEATLAPAPELLSDKSRAKYKPIVYKEYMKSQQSSVLRGKTPLQGIMKDM